MTKARPKKHSLNILGSFYCTDPSDSSGNGCIACGVCYSGAPEFFKEDKYGNAYVYKQPITDSDKELCLEQMDLCPVESINNNG